MRVNAMRRTEKVVHVCPLETKSKEEMGLDYMCHPHPTHEGLPGGHAPSYHHFQLKEVYNEPIVCWWGETGPGSSRHHLPLLD